METFDVSGVRGSIFSSVIVLLFFGCESSKQPQAFQAERCTKDCEKLKETTKFTHFMSRFNYLAKMGQNWLKWVNTTLAELVTMHSKWA